MATYKTSKLEDALASKGFQEDQTHHKMFWLYVNGKKTSVRTRTSHSESEFDDSLLSERKKQLGNLSKQQFIDFMNCPFSAQDLVVHLVNTGRLRLDP